MRIPYFVQGAFFGPALIGLTLVLKVACPASVGAGCFADSLAVPIFLPLIFVYKIVGGGLLMYHAGLIFDLRTPRSPYLPEQRRPL